MTAILHLIIVLVALLALNELFRRSRIATILAFVVLPIALTIFVWPRTTGPETSVNTWFHWAKVYSVLAAVVGFTLMRYTALGEKPYAKAFPALILALNILEAVVRDFELGISAGGAWHFMNAIAGILSIVTISGWTGIHSDKSGHGDLIWNDMTPLWIIAYDIWNIAYIWFCVPEHAAFGISVLLSCTIPAIFVKKGTWIQARAFTLGIWMMYIMTFNTFVDTPGNFLLLPDAPGILLAVGAVSLGINLYLAVDYAARRRKRHIRGFGAEVYTQAA